MTQIATEVLGPAAVEEFSRRRGEPDWLRQARLAAWERYEALPKPTTRDETWRRTDLSSLDLDRLAAPALSSIHAVAPELDVERSTDRAGLLVLHNGRVVQRDLDEQLVGRGVLLMTLAEAVAEQPALVRDHLARQQIGPNENKFDALRAALWTDGALVYVPPGVEVELPLQIAHWDDSPGATLARTLVLAEEASGLTLVDGHASPSDRPESLGSREVHVVARPGARVTCVHLQELDEQSWNIHRLSSEQERDSAVTWLLLELGGRMSRTELTCEIAGQGAESDVIGLLFGQAQQHFDLQSLQDLVGSDTRSDLVLKVALHDRASSTWTGMIRVGKRALRTSSNQENRNLLLDAGARADSDPKLEILNSDVVRCSHGAAVGPVDEEMIFYLMSRGLAHDEAERLIVEGFFEPLLARVPLAGVRERLWSSITGKLER